MEGTFPPFDEDEAFHDLRRAMSSARPPLALIGAGASVGSGYPHWNSLLAKLRDVAVNSGNKGAWRKDVEDLNDALWTAEVLTRKLPPGNLGEVIRSEFKPRETLGEPHLTLARMPFPHFLTTNYDQSIEDALDQAKRKYATVRWQNTKALSDFLITLSHPQSIPSVLYLHGRWDDEEDHIVLTETDYVTRYIASDDARRKLLAIFMTNPVVFIGFSMNDPDLSNLMREVTARLQAKPPCHFALMGYKTEGDREAIRERMEFKFGVRPVFFSRIPVAAGDGKDEYSNLVHLLDALAGVPPRNPQLGQGKVVKPIFDPDDPNKGRFGGRCEVHGRRLSVRKVSGTQERGYLSLEIKVEVLPGAEPLNGPVTFVLHPSFGRRPITVRPKDGSARIECEAYGAFTIGVRTDDGGTQLEYDLAMDFSLPLWFRRQ